MKILHKKCDYSLSQEKTLPLNSYIVSYIFETKLCYDVVQSNSSVEIFNYYYDNYRNVSSIDFTKGSTNPKSYNISPKENKKRKTT